MQINTEMRAFLNCLLSQVQISICIYRYNIILTSNFNKKFASAFVFSSVIHSILDFVVAFWKM